MDRKIQKMLNGLESVGSPGPHTSLKDSSLENTKNTDVNAP